MSLNKIILNRLRESTMSPESSMHETVVVNGNWYWKSRGVCWTQPTDKSSPRKEITEEEYRKVCSSAKSGVTDAPTKKETPATKDTKKKDPPASVDNTKAREDYFGSINRYQIGRSGNFEKDMNFTKNLKTGVTAELVYGDRSREYVRKIGPNKWKSDSGMSLTDNDVVTVAYDSGKATINYMNKYELRNKNSKETKSPEEPRSIKSVSNEVDKYIEDYAKDEETVATLSGSKRIIFELGERDMNNTKLINALKKSGFKQQSSFRYTYEG